MDIDKDILDCIVVSGNNFWCVVFFSVKGIYFLMDSKIGLFYVGKVDGDVGIWGYWC